MSRVLRFEWVTIPTTTAGHMSTGLVPTDYYTREFVKKAISIPASTYGFDAIYLSNNKAFKHQSITVRKGKELV